MDRINGADHVDIGGGKRGFRDENVVNGAPGTEVTAAFLNAVQEEILKVIEEAGIVPDPNNWTQLWEAIGIMIANALSGIVTDKFLASVAGYDQASNVLTLNMSDATTLDVDLTDLIDDTILNHVTPLLTNNLVYPEIETNDNRLAITDNADGTLTVDAAQSWLWRGLLRFSSDDFVLADRTVTTLANRTYHLRWHAPGTGTAVPEATYPKGRFELADLTGASPSEEDPSYDRTHDMMLIARIITDGSNVPTVTVLANAAMLHALVSSNARNSYNTYTSSPSFYHTFSLNFAAAPRCSLEGVVPPGFFYDSDYQIYVHSRDRYAVIYWSWSWHHSGSTGYASQSPGMIVNMEA